MPREILHGAREFLQHAAGFHGHNEHDYGRAETYNNVQDISNAPHGQVPLGYRREVHVHTVLVPEAGSLGFFAAPLAWFTHNMLPILVGALLLGTLLYVFRRYFFRAARMAKERGRELAEIGKEKAQRLKYRAEDWAELGKEKAYDIKFRAEELADRGLEKAQVLKRKAQNVAVEGRDRASELKQNIKGRVSKTKNQMEEVDDWDRTNVYDREYYIERPVRRRISYEDFEDTIGQVELDKHRRGVEYAEFEDDLHTADETYDDISYERPVYVERRRPVSTRKRPAKVTTTVSTEVTEPNGVTTKKKIVKNQDDVITSSTTRSLDANTTE